MNGTTNGLMALSSVRGNEIPNGVSSVFALLVASCCKASDDDGNHWLNALREVQP